MTNKKYNAIIEKSMGTMDMNVGRRKHIIYQA
jgi:hypothetical protein